MNIRQFFDYDTWTYTYLLWDPTTLEAAIIDPVIEQVRRDTTIMAELGLTLRYILDTHVHADHITGSGSLQLQFPEAQIGLSGHAEVIGADLQLQQGDTLSLGDEIITVLETPGHTYGCLSFSMDGAVFTGDALLIRGNGRTDFQQGSSEHLYSSVTNQLFSLPADTVVYPGHDYKGQTQSTIGEELKYNPRLAKKTQEEFVTIMSDLHLPTPKKLDIALPANLRCGKPI